MSYCPSIFLPQRNLFRFPANFSTVFFFYCSVLWTVCIFWKLSLFMFADIFFHSVGGFFFLSFFFMVSFAVQRTSLVAQTIKHLSTMWEIRVRSLGREDPLEKEMATHSSTLAWKIPWTEESPWDYKESTEQLNFLFFVSFVVQKLWLHLICVFFLLPWETENIFAMIYVRECLVCVLI